MVNRPPWSIRLESFSSFITYKIMSAQAPEVPSNATPLRQAETHLTSAKIAKFSLETTDFPRQPDESKLKKLLGLKSDVQKQWEEEKKLQGRRYNVQIQRLSGEVDMLKLDQVRAEIQALQVDGKMREQAFQRLVEGQGTESFSRQAMHRRTAERQTLPVPTRQETVQAAADLRIVETVLRAAEEVADPVLQRQRQAGLDSFAQSVSAAVDDDTNRDNVAQIEGLSQEGFTNQPARERVRPIAAAVVAGKDIALPTDQPLRDFGLLQTDTVFSLQDERGWDRKALTPNRQAVGSALKLMTKQEQQKIQQEVAGNIVQIEQLQRIGKVPVGQSGINSARGQIAQIARQYPLNPQYYEQVIGRFNWLVNRVVVSLHRERGWNPNSDPLINKKDTQAVRWALTSMLNQEREKIIAGQSRPPPVQVTPIIAERIGSADRVTKALQ